MTTTHATNEQLELGFNGSKPRVHAIRREGRIARANWWFAKMRTAVENAIDWRTVNEPRAEQTWMPGTHREVKV